MIEPTVPQLLAWSRSEVAWLTDHGMLGTPDADMWQALEKLLSGLAGDPPTTAVIDPGDEA